MRVLSSLISGSARSGGRGGKPGMGEGGRGKGRGMSVSVKSAAVNCAPIFSILRKCLRAARKPRPRRHLGSQPPDMTLASPFFSPSVSVRSQALHGAQRCSAREAADRPPMLT